MIRKAKNIYVKVFAAIMLLTAEALIGLVLSVISLVVFLLITGYVFLEHRKGFDEDAFNYLAKHVSPLNSQIMLFFTSMGNFSFLLTANLLLILYFLLRKHRWYSIKVAAVALSSVGMMFLLKTWFNRPRPPVPLLDPAIGLSFPSGHAMSSVTFYGLIICLSWQSKSIKKEFRIAIMIILVMLILMIGLSRIYLKVHYASDVLGGYCAGVIWLSISLYVTGRIEKYSRTVLDQVVKKAS